MFKTSEVSAGKKMAIAANYQPPDVPLNIQVIRQPGLTKILDLNFTYIDYLLILYQAKTVKIILL
jgi:hypothetical protein